MKIIPHHSDWKPVTKRDTRSRILRQHRLCADEIGIRAYARQLEMKPGTLSRYLKGDYKPKRRDIVSALSLRPPRPKRVYIRKPVNTIWPENTVEFDMGLFQWRPE